MAGDGGERRNTELTEGPQRERRKRVWDFTAESTEEGRGNRKDEIRERK
jgi:hypothetical protein